MQREHVDTQAELRSQRRASSCVISGQLGNLSELQLRSFRFLECVKGKLTSFQSYHAAPLAQSLLWSIQGVVAAGTMAESESEDLVISLR